MSRHYSEKRDAKVNLMHALCTLGWNCHGYKPDKSDSMTDYYDPAHWSGIATKDERTLVVDDDSGSNSGRDVQKSVYLPGDPCQRCKTTGYDPLPLTYRQASKDPDGFRAAMDSLEGVPGVNVHAIPRNVRGDLFETDGRLKCIACQGRGHAWNHTFQTVYTYPTYQRNPSNSIWHVERGGQIIAKGIGLTKCADSNDDLGPLWESLRLARKIDGTLCPAWEKPQRVILDIYKRDPERDERALISLRLSKVPDNPTRDALNALQFYTNSNRTEWHEYHTPEREELARGLLARFGGADVSGWRKDGLILFDATRGAILVRDDKRYRCDYSAMAAAGFFSSPYNHAYLAAWDEHSDAQAQAMVDGSGFVYARISTTEGAVDHLHGDYVENPPAPPVPSYPPPCYAF